jgi:hypothetical protein
LKTSPTFHHHSPSGNEFSSASVCLGKNANQAGDCSTIDAEPCEFSGEAFFSVAQSCPTIVANEKVLSRVVHIKREHIFSAFLSTDFAVKICLSENGPTFQSSHASPPRTVELRMARHLPLHILAPCPLSAQRVEKASL